MDAEIFDFLSPLKTKDFPEGAPFLFALLYSDQTLTNREIFFYLRLCDLFKETSIHIYENDEKVKVYCTMADLYFLLELEGIISEEHKLTLNQWQYIVNNSFITSSDISNKYGFGKYISELEKEINNIHYII